MIIVLSTSHTTPTTQALYSTTSSQPNIHYFTTGIHHPSPLYRICELCVPCYCLVFTWHDVTVPIIRSHYTVYCLCAYYFTCCLFIYGLFDFCIVCLTFYASVYSCDGVRLSHWIKGYLTWLEVSGVRSEITPKVRYKFRCSSLSYYALMM